MSQPKFTPGPWICDIRVGCVAVYAGEPRNCLSGVSGDALFYKPGYKTENANGLAQWNTNPQDEANAHLIAAAPCMYEAGVELDAALGAYFENPTVANDRRRADATIRLQAALAKARGEQP